MQILVHADMKSTKRGIIWIIMKTIHSNNRGNYTHQYNEVKEKL